MRPAVAVSVACAVLVAGRDATADKFDPETVPFAVTFNGETSSYTDTSAFLMPGASATLEVVNGVTGRYSLSLKEEGSAVQQGPRRWRYTAPARPGLYTLELDGPGHNDSVDIHVFVLVPASQVKNGWLNGYRIGSYPPASKSYTPPKGFVEVTKDNEDTKVSPHFRLKQLICRQDTLADFPKYVVLEQRLLLKLETILERVNRMGFSTDTLHVMSAYRTPYYNHAIGDVKYSQHQWGSAADVYIDPHDKDRMEDLNRDGRIDIADSKFLYDRIEEWFERKDLQKFEGGLGFYPATAAHPPFVHVDVRGTKARWKG
jgi:peptidase M15-like protein